jgi:hypothetical protein
VLALAFLVTILLGTGLLMLPWASASGQSAPWLTATSAVCVCVTGQVVVDTGTDWRALALEPGRVAGVKPAPGHGFPPSRRSHHAHRI